ncbi:MAG: hypothetical protein AB1531_11985, partial [Chloroflexota bacterium]
MASRHTDNKWWTRSSASRYFSKELMRYFVQLYISYKADGDNRRLPSTGILVEVNRTLLWISAGHVVESIIEQYGQGSICDLRWIDRFDVQGAETLPFQRRDIQYYSGLTKGADCGAILLSILESDNFRHNKNLRPLVMRTGTQAEPITEPEGYVLAGFPWEASNVTHTPVSSRKEMVRLSSELICLPLVRKPWRDVSIHEDRWEDEDAFYGQLLPYSDVEGSQPEELRGMSGGPVFSFHRDGDILNIELEGIFDSYSKKT